MQLFAVTGTKGLSQSQICLCVTFVNGQHAAIKGFGL